jgi:hypothetical protein
VRLKDVTQAQRRLLGELASRISDRLEAHFVELPNADDGRIGIALHEGTHKVVMDISTDMLLQATGDAAGREVLRTRMKARRDRMMFKAPPAALPKHIAPMFSPAPPRGNSFRGGRR